MLPYVFVARAFRLSAEELNESLSVLNSYDRDLPLQLEKLRAAMLEARNKQESVVKSSGSKFCGFGPVVKDLSTAPYCIREKGHEGLCTITTAENW